MCCGRTSMPAILARRSRTLPPANGASAAWPEAGKVLERRIATAVVLAAAGLLAVFFLPRLWFAAAAAGLLLVAGGWEAARLAGLTNPALRWLYGLVLAAAGAAMHLSSMPAGPFLAATCVLLLLCFVLLCCDTSIYPCLLNHARSTYSFSSFLLLALCHVFYM